MAELPENFAKVTKGLWTPGNRRTSIERYKTDLHSWSVGADAADPFGERLAKMF